MRPRTHSTTSFVQILSGPLQPRLDTQKAPYHLVYRQHRGTRRRQDFRNHTARCQAASLSGTPAVILNTLHTQPWQDVGAMVVSILGGLLLVKAFDSLSHHNIVEKVLLRSLTILWLFITYSCHIQISIFTNADEKAGQCRNSAASWYIC